MHWTILILTGQSRDGLQSGLLRLLRAAKQDVPAAGLKAIRALKEGLDPVGVTNPDKLVPAFAGLGLREAPR
jgi:hypothetical protein